MTLPLYEIAKGSAQVLLLLGGPEPRLYPWGRAGRSPQYPYAVFQVVGGDPQNTLAGRTALDSVSVQLDVYAADAGGAEEVRDALRHALELDCCITSLRGEMRDEATGSYRAGFDSDWWLDR